MNKKLTSQNWPHAWRSLPRGIQSLLNGIVLLSLVAFPFSTLPVRADQGETNSRLVYRNHGYISAEQFAPHSEISFTFYESDSLEDQLFFTTKGADENGNVGLQVWEWSFPLEPDNYLVVSDGISTKEHAIKLISMDVFDPQTDLLSGTAEPGEFLYVYAQNEETYCWLETHADGNGNWTADFGSAECNVTDDMWTAAMVFDEDGDVSEATRPAALGGHHGHDGGDGPSWACNAGGWTIDPDYPFESLDVRIRVDGEILVDSLLADEEREDLLNAWAEGGGGCPGGTCSFHVSLWDMITHYEPHEIVVEAQDLQTGEWHPLPDTHKTLTCRTYDIYTYNPETGETVQLTNLREADEYSPSWSASGKKVVYDVWYGDHQDLWVTDLQTGTSKPLSGGEGGGDAVWSPDGKWIVFDQAWMGDNNLYRVSEEGGNPALVKADAIQAAWSPDSKRLVYHQPSDGSLMTSGARGDGSLFLASSGAHPAWSPDGKYVAYEDGGAVFRIRVDAKGAPLGEPVQVTFLPGWEGMPAWSADSHSIVFHYGFGGDFDIWSVPVTGGTPSWLTGAFGFGDYDPAATKNSPLLAYASFSPEGQAPRRWVAAYTYDMPAGYWSEGDHVYHFEWEDLVSGDFHFSASQDEQTYDGFVLLRGGQILADGGEGCFSTWEINTGQHTQFHSGWLAVDTTYAGALDYFEGLGVKVGWDGLAPVEMAYHEIRPFDSLDWWSYVCTYTQPPNRSLSIGNFAVEWSPYNVEEIRSLRWKGSENLVNSWVHGLYPWGTLEYFGNSWATESEGDELSYFRSLVGWGTAGSWAHNGTQVKIQSMSTFTSEPTIPIQTSYRFFDDDKRADLIAVERTFEFDEEAYTHDIRPFIPRLFPRDEFTQVLHPNAMGKALMTVLAEECEFGCEVKNWNGTWFAIHNPFTGQGMLVIREPSSYEARLWVDVDGGSWTNASSVLLLQPEGGFTGEVTETEYLCFFDSSTWTPSRNLPASCLPGPESSLSSLFDEQVNTIYLPATLLNR
jgi:hypothetical protein